MLTTRTNKPTASLKYVIPIRTNPHTIYVKPTDQFSSSHAVLIDRRTLVRASQPLSYALSIYDHSPVVTLAYTAYLKRQRYLETVSILHKI